MKISRLVQALGALVFMVCLAVSTAEARSPRFVVTDFSVDSHLVYARDANRKRADTVGYHKSVTVKSGWWFSSYNTYYNENIGMHARDIMAERLSKYFDTNLQPRLDSSLADKRAALSNQLDLSGADLTRAVAKLSPVRLGRELGADYAVTGNFQEIETRSNRFWGGITTSVNVTVTVFCVRSGKAVFSQQYDSSKWGRSQYGTFDNLAKRIVQDITATLGSGQ